MSNPCLATTCLNGNCPGCRSGSIFCDDPRCYPNCPGCPNSAPSNSNWVIVTIILVLLGVLLVMAFIIGYSWYNDRKKASEPKRVIVNKHMHTVVPAPIIVTSPAPIAPIAPIVTTSTPIITSSDCPQNVMSSPQSVISSFSSPTSNVSYNGMNFSMN